MIMNQYETRQLFTKLNMRDYQAGSSYEQLLQSRLDAGYMLDAPNSIPTGACFQGKTHSPGAPIMATYTRD